MHLPPRLVEFKGYMPRPVFYPDLPCWCVWVFHIQYLIQLHFLTFSLGAFVFWFLCFWLQRPHLTAPRLRLPKELCSAVRWRRNPTGSHQAYFQNPARSSSMPPLLIALTTLAYCLIQSQTTLYILHVSTGLSYVGMKQSRILGTEESLMQKAETHVNLDCKLLVPLPLVSTLPCKVQTTGLNYCREQVIEINICIQ